MKVLFKEIGNGVERIEVVFNPNERKQMPQHAFEHMINDAINQRRCEDFSRREVEDFVSRISRPVVRPMMRDWDIKREISDELMDLFDINPQVLSREMRPMEEPHGIDIHVDRPQRQNFRSFYEWDDAMTRYRNLETSAKLCSWPSQF